MPLLTVARYRLHTGDSSHSVTEDEERIALAEELLAEALDRPLVEDERTERMWPTRDGRLWPKAIPVIVVPSSYTIDGHALRGAGPLSTLPDWFRGTEYVEVTYTGGWVERTAEASADAPNRLPLHMEIDLAWAAYRLGRPDPLPTSIPAGATSVRLGDAAVTYAKGGPRPGSTVGWWSAATLAYRYRPIGTPVTPREVLL